MGFLSKAASQGSSPQPSKKYPDVNPTVKSVVPRDVFQKPKQLIKIFKARPVAVFVLLLILFVAALFLFKNKFPFNTKLRLKQDLSQIQPAPLVPGKSFGQGNFIIKEPTDKEITVNVGTVSITTWNPVTITSLENSTNLYFKVKNTGSTSATLQFLSWDEIQSTKPSWIFQFASYFGDKIDIKLAAGESKTVEFYISKDLTGNEQQAQLPFRFKVSETGATVDIPITLVARSSNEPLQQYISSSIEGRITSPDGKPISNADVIAFFLNIDNKMHTKTDGNGNFAIDVTAIEDLKKVLGNRDLPYPTLSYFVVAEKQGYTFGYRDGVTPTKTNNAINVDFTLKPVVEPPSYNQVGEFKSDGPYGYWWVRYVSSSNRVVAVQGQHPPELESPGHVVMLDLSGKELWRFPTDSACWGFDVSPDGKLIAIGSKGAFLYVINDSGQLIWKKNLGSNQPQEVNGVRFSPDGQYLVAGRNRQVSLFKAQTGEVIWTLDKIDEQNVRWSPDGQRIIAGNNQLTQLTKDGATLWTAWLGEYPLFLQIDANYNVYASGKTREMFSYDKNGNLRWRYRLAQTTNNMNQAMSQDGKLIVAHTFSGILYAFNNMGTVLWQRPIYIGDDSREGPGHQGISVSSDGELILIGDRIYGLSLYDSTGSLLWRTTSTRRLDFKFDIEMHGHQTGVLSVDLSSDKQYIVAGYSDSVVRIFKRVSP